jgi:hypothetical protein
MFDPLCKLRPRPGSPPAPTAGAFFFREFVTSADSAPAPQIAPLPGNGSDEQMFGAEQQIPPAEQSD